MFEMLQKFTYDNVHVHQFFFKDTNYPCTVDINDLSIATFTPLHCNTDQNSIGVILFSEQRISLFM